MDDNSDVHTMVQYITRIGGTRRVQNTAGSTQMWPLSGGAPPLTPMHRACAAKWRHMQPGKTSGGQNDKSK